MPHHVWTRSSGSGSGCGSAGSLRLSAAGSLQHQSLWRQESIQQHSDGHHQHGLKARQLLFYALNNQESVYGEISALADPKEVWLP